LADWDLASSAAMTGVTSTAHNAAVHNRDANLMGELLRCLLNVREIRLMPEVPTPQLST
jgi:hypothetical protein